VPLLIGANVVAPDAPQPVWTEDVGTMVATWTTPDGAVIQLSNTSPDMGWFTTSGPAGWGANPVSLVTDPLANGGEQVRFIRSEARRITWPLHVYGQTYQQFQQRYRRIMRAFTMTTQRRAPGILTVYLPDGSARFIAAYYETGFGGEGGENWLSANPVLTLYCPDGYWSDVDPITVTRRGGSTVEASFYNPFINLGQSQTLGATVINNPGEIDAWPTWTITGPMSKITAVNETLGVQFALTTTLTEGQQVRITTNRPTVRGPGDSNLTGKLDWPSAVLWPLVPGDNAINFALENASSSSQVSMSFYPRYEAV
jgi:hypothetical protein